MVKIKAVGDKMLRSIPLNYQEVVQVNFTAIYKKQTLSKLFCGEYKVK